MTTSLTTNTASGFSQEAVQAAVAPLGVTPSSLTKDSHTTIKSLQGGILHYAVIVNERVIASLELQTALCGNYWVRHSVSEVSHQGYGFALYSLAMQDVYPLGIMPSRECTSGHAVSLWQKIFIQEEITQNPVNNPKVYCDEFDEWLDEVLEVNPSLNREEIENLEVDFSLIGAVQEGLIKPHPYNTSYHFKPNCDFVVIECNDSKYSIESQALFDRRYETLDF